MHIIQFELPPLGRCLGVVKEGRVENITERYPELSSIYTAFLSARRNRERLPEMLQRLAEGTNTIASLSYAELLSSGRVLAPVTQETGTHLLVSGTGLTHRPAPGRTGEISSGLRPDAQKMLEMGIRGGRPVPNERGVAPEWFYKGDGRILRGTGQSLEIPSFAPDGGEEPEVVAVYIVDEAGIPCRLGFTQGNEWTDHATDGINYLYVASGKIRTCAIGPELVTSIPFDDIRGRCRVLREGKPIYDSGELFTGEQNMVHSLANLEDHHFKFPQHRIPGDIHVRFLGTSKTSFPHRQWQYETGDIIEVSFQSLGAPLCNPVQRWKPDQNPFRAVLG